MNDKAFIEFLKRECIDLKARYATKYAQGGVWSLEAGQYLAYDDILSYINTYQKDYPDAGSRKTA